MTVRTDLSVNFNLIPRLITVAAPSTEITLQDLVDTLRQIEDELINMDEDHLIDAAGKEDLGGGVNVGITATLKNALIAFDARITPDESGTATSIGTTTLVDTAATFVTNLIVPGAMLINYTDNSIATVISVTNETTLTHQTLQGGSANDWTAGDVYTVTNEIQCNVSGGNLVAVDAVGASIDPIFPTVGTQVIRTSSSSATLTSQSAIEFASYNNGVTVSATGAAGTAFPIGTIESPVNNIPDAMLIAADKGFSILYVNDVFTFQATDNVDEMIVIGEGMDHTFLTVASGCSTSGAAFKNCTLDGTFSTTEPMVFQDIIADALIGVTGSFFRIIFRANVTLDTVEQSRFIDCSSGIPGATFPTFDLGGASPGVVWRKWDGGLGIGNLTSGDCSVDVISGQTTLSANMTGGTLVARGAGKLTDNSAGTVVTDEMTFSRLNNLWQLQGLDIPNPMTVTPAARTAGTIAQTISGDGETTTTITRTS